MIDLLAFLDTESTGLPRKDLPKDDPAQPHLLQIAMKLTTRERRVVGRVSRIIRPDGYHIEPEAERVHGISERLAHECGVPRWLALAELRATVEQATQVIGFNLIMFDRPLIDNALKRESVDAGWWARKSSSMYDCMERAAPILKLAGPIPNEPKFPTLEEAVNGLRQLHEPPSSTWKPSGSPPRFTTKHNADEDVDATEEVYWLLQRGTT